jgi:cytochrome P450
MPETTETPGGMSDLMTPELAREPQPVFRALLEGAPVMRVEGVGVVACSRAAVEHVLRNPDVFSSDTSAQDLQTRRPLIPLQIDPPRQRTFRKLLDPLFAPKRMYPLEEPITTLVNELIDGFEGEDEIDFTARFSIPFPSQVFLTLFGLPTDELDTFLRMKDGIIRPHHVVGTPIHHPDAIAHQKATADSIYGYFEALLDERASVRRDDLVSQFLDAEVDGDRLGREDILDICFLFLIAGLDTVSASLDCFFGYLATHPDDRRALVADPASIPHVVEELLRWETPVMGTARVATCPAQVAGLDVQAGEQVMTLLGAANLDDDELADAGVVRWDRDVNRHLAFGGGVHRCLGSHLARIELRVALAEWHRRIPDYRVQEGVELEFTPGIRALDTFPMVLGRSS